MLPVKPAARSAMTLSHLSQTLRLRVDLAQGQGPARGAVELLAGSSDNPQLLATASTTLGNVLMAKAQYEEAGDQYRVALASYRNGLGNEHPRVALVAHNLGTALRLADNCAEAIRFYDMAVEIAEVHYPPQHPELLESRRQRQLCNP